MKTFADLKAAAFLLMDEGQSQYLSDVEMGNYVNAAYAEITEVVMTEDPWRLQQEFVYTPVAAQRDYPLPLGNESGGPIAGNLNTFRRALRVFAQSGSRAVRLREFNPSEYGRSCVQMQWQFPRYRIMGNKLRLDPVPQTTPNWQLVLWYIPYLPQLVAPTDLTPYAYLPLIEQWIVNRAVIYAKLKEEVSVYDFEQQNARLTAAIVTELRNGRDTGEDNRIIYDDPIFDQYEGWL